MTVSISEVVVQQSATARKADGVRAEETPPAASCAST
jgi:hypothetical protein